MSRLARRLAQALIFPPVLPPVRRPALGPHAIVLLLAAATALLSPGLLSEGEPPSAGTAECAVLQAFFESPQALASFQGTPEEMQRWVDAYDQHCR